MQRVDPKNSKPYRLPLTVNKKQEKWVKSQAKKQGTSTSQFLREMIDKVMGEKNPR